MAESIFITGGNGFLGSALLPLLAARGYKLRCLLRRGSDRSKLATYEHETIEGDLGEETALREGLEGMDWVIHLAAAVSMYKPDAALMRRVNVSETAGLARLAREAGVARFLQVSSVAAVGYSADGEPIDEDAPYNWGHLRIPYCDTKRAGEEAVQAEGRAGMEVVTVNPSSMIGVGDRRKGEASIFASAARGRIPFAPPGGINFADLRDVAAGCMAAIEKGRAGERYILAGDNLRGREFVGSLLRLAGHRPPRLALPMPVARLAASLATAYEWLRPLSPPITAQAMRMASRLCWYSSDKAANELGYRTRGIEDAMRMALVDLKTE